MRAAALVLVCVLAGCGSDSTPTVAPDGAIETNESGGACIANDLACAPKADPCVGDCQGKSCCSGICAISICGPDNVQLGGTCPTACGGTPTGTWRVAGACLPDCPGPGAGTFVGKGTITVSETGSTAGMDLGFDVRCGGYINSGSPRTLSGVWDKTATTIDGSPYCVDGDTLWIFSKTTALGSYALKLTRA